MRLSTFFSLAVHVGVVTAGFFWGQEEMRTSSVATPMIVIPLELMTIGEVTDIAPVIKAEEEDKTATEEEAQPVYAAAAPPPPPEDTVNLDEPKKAEPKKAEAKPAPPKEDINDFIAQMEQNALAEAKKKQPNAAPAPAGKTATADNSTQRMGAGEMRKTQVTITDYIRSQLILNRCWTDHSDMADAQRLTATFRVRFTPGGKFAAPPELREPSREPFNDPPLQTFIQHGRTALAKCNQIGWKIPPEYFRLEPAPYWIDIELVPQVAAMQ